MEYLSSKPSQLFFTWIIWRNDKLNVNIMKQFDVYACTCVSIFENEKHENNIFWMKSVPVEYDASFKENSYCLNRHWYALGIWIK